VVFPALALAVLGTGCVNALEPDVGAPLRELCVNEDSDPLIETSFSRDIRGALFEDVGGGCVLCHLPGGIGTALSGLELSTYETLRAGGTASGTSIVVPGVPCDSIIWQKVSPAPPSGARMPLNRPPLSSVQIRTLRDWIAEGARDN